MVDCSHGNSNKQHQNQILVAEDLAAQMTKGSRQVMGVMIESFIEAGRQDIVDNSPQNLVYPPFEKRGFEFVAFRSAHFL